MTHYPSPDVALTMSDLFENPSLRAYLKNVRDWHGYIRLLGLADWHDSGAYFIDMMYVPMQLTRRAVSLDENPAAWQRQAQPVHDALAQDKPLLVLGDPGSGKTTLLDSLIWQLSRPDDNNPLVAKHGWRLPVPMVLRELRLAGVRTFDDLLEAFLAHQMSEPLRENSAFLRDMIARGQAFIFLDGLDEVPQEARESLRDAVLEGIAQFPRCQWLLTSRIVGYDEVPYHVEDRAKDTHGDEGRRFDRRHDDNLLVRFLAPFDDSRIRQFASCWYSCREPSALAAGKDADLVKAIHADNAILPLARAPSLLALMALVHRVDATLPHERTVLYDRITEAYLESIDKSRGLMSDAHDLPRKKWLLGRIGYEMQRRRTHGDAAEGSDILVDYEDLVAWMDDELAKDRSEAPYSAEQFLSFVARRSGLLSPRGEGRFAFRHLSFQEYFAALAMEREVTGYRWAKHGETSLGFSEQNLTSMASEPVWLETFVYLFEMLRYQPDWYGELLQRIFGSGFSKLRGTDSKVEDALLNLSYLAAQLAANPYSGLGKIEREDAIKACIQMQFRYDSQGHFEYFGRRSNYDVLLGEDPDRNATTLAIIVECIADLARNLEYPRLVLANTNIANLGFIDQADHCADLASLRRLVLDGTGVRDVAPLARLTSLEILDLRGTEVDDIKPLARLTSLQYLDLAGTGVRDVAPLAMLTSLEVLDLRGTEVDDIKLLARLTSLRHLALAGTGVRDVAPLAMLTSLETLDLRSTEVGDISSLASLTKLRSVLLPRATVSEEDVSKLKMSLPNCSIQLI